MTTWALCILAAYLIGSIPFGVLIGLARGVDIRQHGSKNIGATNVTRVLGRKLGMLCFVLDFCKGAAPIVGAGLLMDVIDRSAAELTSAQMWLWLAVAAAAVLGHMFSIFLGLRGGKGVATAFGAMAAMWPLLTVPAFVALAIWYGVLRLTKYVSLASMIAAASVPLGYLIWELPPQGTAVIPHLLHASPPFVVTGALALLVIYKHRANIDRLRRGEEPRAGGSARRGDVMNTR